ncbi:MAG: ABC transporter permease subunit [Actinomycetota bacterium]
MLPAGIVAFGIVAGCLAGLNAIGFVVIWRTTRVINLAQPTIGILAGVLTGMLVTSAGWSFWWAAPVGLAAGAALSILAERTVIARLREVPRSVLLVATVGIAQIAAATTVAIPFIFGGRLPTYTVDLGVTWYLEPQLLLGPHFLAMLALPLAAWGSHLYLTRSRVGIAALAVGQDEDRATALGVPAGSVRMLSWGLAGLVGATSGILSIPILGFGLEGGALAPTVLLLALAPAVFAGMKSVWAAAGSALVLGVIYGAAVWYSRGGGVADLVLAFAVVAAIALKRRQLGREDVARRASSWEAAATPRPLPWRVAASRPVRALLVAVVMIAATLALLVPLLLSPSLRVAYGTAAAFALAAMGVCTAWLFAGELPLGHWGFAGLGAALGASVPVAWPLRATLAAIAIGAVNAFLGHLTRHRSNLSFAMIGLAAAAVAPVAISELGRGVIRADTRLVGIAAGLITLASAVALIWFRNSLTGVRFTAARDDPERARWLGADRDRGRLVGLGLSGMMVGAAGVLFVAATPAGIAPGAFDPTRSLALLAVAVIGGLGSPAGVVVGAIVITTAERVLPSPWNALTSGIGVVLVCSLIPSGFAAGVTWLRDRAVGLLTHPQRTGHLESSSPEAA